MKFNSNYMHICAQNDNKNKKNWENQTNIKDTNSKKKKNKAASHTTQLNKIAHQWKRKKKLKNAPQAVKKKFL